MTVNDCMKEIRQADNAIDILQRFKNGEMTGIANQHIEEIITVICNYVDLLSMKEVKQ